MQICFHGADTTETIDITSASLDDPECLPPRSHTYFQNRVRWVCVDDGLPRHDQELPR